MADADVLQARMRHSRFDGANGMRPKKLLSQVADTVARHPIQSLTAAMCIYLKKKCLTVLPPPHRYVGTRALSLPLSNIQLLKMIALLEDGSMEDVDAAHSQFLKDIALYEFRFCALCVCMCSWVCTCVCTCMFVCVCVCVCVLEYVRAYAHV